MIPNKLYIPTTTLNFNNIMASESISPAGFYADRGFGYKRFDKVEPNNLNKRIILYNQYPKFDINDIELENYPLIIEIDPQYIGEDIICEYKNGIFYTEETIYLNPFSSKIYFRSDDEKRRTLSKVEQSLNTKMLPIYQNCIFIKPSEIDSFKWGKNDLTDSTADIAKQISKDRRINKLKGFLYAYLLGANKSLTPSVVILKKYAKELQNLLSAIITSPYGKISSGQEKELNILYKKINECFMQVGGISSNLSKYIKQKSELYNCPNFIEILKKEDLYDTWFQKQKFKPQNSINPFNLSYFYKKSLSKKYSEHDDKLEDSEKYFDNYFRDLENTINKLIRYEKNRVINLPTLQHSSRVELIPTDDKGFQAKLFNVYFEEPWNSEEFLGSRLEFATAGGKLFKEELQNGWENSQSKTYINNLRNNLASHTPFALNSIHNLTLQSFAVFCQKGEESIDKLEDYLITNEISDFRIAFGLWGIIFGFSNMPKTLTNDLFLSADLNYVSDIYKYIFKQVHGIELKGKIEKRENEYVIRLSSMNKQFATMSDKDNSIDSFDSMESKRLYEELLKEVKGVKTDEQQYLNYFNKYGLTQELLDVISNDKSLNKGKGVQKTVVKWVKKQINNLSGRLKTTNVKSSKEGKKEVKRETSILLSQSTGIFLSDFYFLSNNDEFITIVASENKDWKEDLEWFIQSHNISHKDYEKYWKEKPTDNESIIKQFIFLKKELYKSSEELLRKLYLSNE